MLHAKLWPQSVHQPLAGLQFVKRCAALLPGKARWAVHSRAGQRGDCCSRPSWQSQLWFLLGLARFVASHTVSIVLLGVAQGSCVFAPQRVSDATGLCTRPRPPQLPAERGTPRQRRVLPQHVCRQAAVNPAGAPGPPNAMRTSTQLLQSRCNQVWQGPGDPQMLLWFLQVVRAGRRCVDDCGCSRYALYNFLDEPPLYCSDHKRAGMVPPFTSLARRSVAPGGAVPVV